jgi:hypothetical protein
MAGIVCFPPADAAAAATTGDHPWSTYFGEKHNPYPTSSLSLPEIYKGHNPYLTTILIDLVTEEDTVPTKIILPIREVDNTDLTITWDEFHFSKSLLGPVPEEGVSRLVSQSHGTRRDHMVRYGLAFMVEHGFWRTPKGQKVFSMNLQQIKNAQLDALYASVIESLLRSKTMLDVFHQQYGKHITPTSLQRERNMRVESWGQLQKSNYGFDMLTSHACKQLKLAGATPDCWIVDDGVKKYVAGVRRENFQYFLAGPRGQAMYESALGNKTGKAVDVASGMLIHEAKHFDLPELEEPYNLLSRQRTIGEYNTMYPHVTPDENYNTDWRSILVYDELRDGFRRIGMHDAIAGCGRFHQGSGLLDFDNFDDSYDGKDMFMEDGKPAEVFGDLSFEALPKKARDDWVLSIIQKMPKDSEENLEALRRFVDDVEPANVDETTMSEWSVFYNDPRNTDFKKSSLGMTPEPFPSKPIGFGNLLGLQEIASSAYSDKLQEFHKRAKMGVKVVEDAFKLMRQVKLGITKEEVFVGLIGKDSIFPVFLTTTDGGVAGADQMAPVQTAATDICQYVYPNTDGNAYAGQIMNTFGAVGSDDVKTKASAEALMHFAFSPLFEMDDTSEIVDENGASVDDPIELAKHAIKHGTTDLKKDPIYNVFTDGVKPVKKLFFESGNVPIEMAHAACKALFLLSIRKGMMDFYNLASQLTEGNKFSFIMNMKELIEVFATLPVEETEVKIKTLFDAAADAGGEPGVTVLNMSSFKGPVMVLPANTDPPEGWLKTAKAAGVAIATTAAGFLATAAIAAASAAATPVSMGTTYDTANTAAGLITGNLLNSAFMTSTHEVNKKQVSYKGVEMGEYGHATKKVRLTEDGILRVYGDDAKKDSAKSKSYTKSKSYAKSKSNPMYAFFHGVLLDIEITKDSLDRFADNNFVVPFNFILFRPNMTYEMSSGICLKTGATTGETLVGHSDFSLGDNVVRKVYYGNFTMYSRAVVYNHRQCFLAEDMLSTKYLGGNDCVVMTNDEERGSMYICIAPYQSEEYSNPLDITGRDSTLGTVGAGQPLQYPSADFYKKHWSWKHAERPNDRHEAWQPDSELINTECWQGHQSMYNPNTKLHDLVIMNTGHWGPRVYPGCGKARNGMTKLLEEVHYNNVVGGGGQSAALRMQ